MCIRASRASLPHPGLDYCLIPGLTRNLPERLAYFEGKRFAGPLLPNSRTGRGLLRVVPMVAVRQVPITAPGARQVAAEGPSASVDVRLFGEAGEGLPNSREADGYRTGIAESSVAKKTFCAPKSSICPLVKWGMLRLRAYKGVFAGRHPHFAPILRVSSMFPGRYLHSAGRSRNPVRTSSPSRGSRRSRRGCRCFR